MPIAVDPVLEARPLVAIPYPLPDWAQSYLGDEFDFQLHDPESSASKGAEVMLTSGPEKVGRDILAELPELRYICCLGSGMEGVDTAYARERGIPVSNSATITAQDVADQMVALTLAHYCRILPLDRAIRDGRWHKPMRPSLRELKVGILGFGAIGQAVAQRMAAFGCDIRWTGPRPKDTCYVYEPQLSGLAYWADMILIAARADQSNAGLVNDAVFEQLRPDGFIANISRGSVLDEDALIAALREGRLGGAALDVFATEPTPPERWRDVPNIILSPHVGGYATGVRRGIQQLVQSNLRAFFAGEPIKGVAG